MGFPSFLLVLVFFLVSHLLVVHSTDSCPSSFNCGKLGQIRYPFTNSSTALPCGWFPVSCETDPKVLLGGRNYQVSKITNDTIELKDPIIEGLIKNRSCNFSIYDNPLNYGHVSLTISRNLTFIKCDTSNPELERQPVTHFPCDVYTVYCSYPNQPVEVPRNCASFQLPVVSPDKNPNPWDLFSLLTSDFSLEYHVSKECLECHEDGRDCPHCFTKRKDVKEREGKKRLVLIFGTAVPAVGIMVILLLCIIVKKLTKGESTFFWKKKTENYRNIEVFLKNCGSLAPKRYTYTDIKKITNSFKTKLGQGGFGCVFKGKLNNGCLVAVKVLKGLKGEGEDFINEVATISRTSHVNIVTLLGFCFEGRHRALIYEFMPKGSLDKFIHDGGSLTYRQLSWEALYQIVVGIARGLEYLHRGCNTRILHFDIKPHNILLNDDFCPKISDFGLAILCPQKESIISLSGTRGTAGYIAPEVFSRHFGRVSYKSDVYSYGMMVLEMVGVRKNNRVEVDHSSEVYFPHWVYKRLEQGEELGLQGNMDDAANASARKMIIVGLWCIQTDPSHRPSMSRVVEMLEGSSEPLQTPPKPFLSSPSRSHVELFSLMS